MIRKTNSINTAYPVKNLDADKIKPSPENDAIYGEVVHDEQMDDLINSIRLLGLEEPIIVSKDYFVISGHRRLFACQQLGMDVMPVRVKGFSRKQKLSDWPRILAQYNPQRVKGPASLLRESLLRISEKKSFSLIKDYNAARLNVDAEFMEVHGHKHANPIGRRSEFLESAKKVLEELKDFLPTSVRTIHYGTCFKSTLTITVWASHASR